MCKSVALFVGTLLCSMLSIQSTLADDGAALIGVWKLVAFDLEFRDGRPAQALYGKNPTGFLIFTPQGRMSAIIEGKDAGVPEPVWILRIFLSVFEPHLQRAPVAGTVKQIAYKKGIFLDARNPRAPFENEQNRIEIVPSPRPSPDGRGRSGAAGEATIVVTQIAGLIARRIVCWVKEGQNVQAGERIGLIRFGSQVEIVFSKSAKLRVKAGDFVTAGDTVIAEL